MIGECMSRLYGFKYTVSNSGTHDFIRYVILSEINGKCYIDDYINGAKKHFDVTNNIDKFCKEITELGIDAWNMNVYQSSIYWFPPADQWTFELNTDDFSVVCKGQGEVPPNWNKFWTAFNKMCNKNKCRCHSIPKNGIFQVGTDYEYSYIIDGIYVIDDNGDKFYFDDYTFLWYFAKL